MFKKNDSPKIEYWSVVGGLNSLDDVRPQPLKNYIPDWWKSMPKSFGESKRTAKMCPSFTDIFSSAYVLPMWCDSVITRKNNVVYWETSHEVFEWEFHHADQFLKHSPSWLGEKVWSVMKPLSPWWAKTTPGYSIYQMPMFYDFNTDFTVMPGIIHTDVYHELNPQVMMFSNKKEVFIKRGQPLCLHFPFKRSKISIETREINSEDENNIKKSGAIVKTKFINAYRNRTKNFMSGEK